MGKTKAIPVVCGMCETVRKKLPSSWIHTGSTAYCSSCWATVVCSQCGHHDPKGEVFRGRWRCRGCSHRQRTSNSARDLLDAYHREVIADGNGEASPTSGAEAEVASWRSVEGRRELAVSEAHKEQEHAEEEDDDDEALEAAEGGDALAPLPGAGRPGRGGQAAAERRTQRAATCVVLLLDMSGSMRTADVRPGTSAGSGKGQDAMLARFEAAVQCACDFVKAHQQLYPSDVFSLVTFNESAELLCRGLDAAGACGALEAVPPRCSNGTFYRAALAAGAGLFSLRPGALVHMLLLSDGRPADPKAALEYFQAELLRGSGSRPPAEFHLHGIGFGETVSSFAALQQLSCLGGGAFALAGSSVRSLCNAFATVSSTITSLSSRSSLGEAESGEQAAGQVMRAPRQADFELPELGVFGKNGVLRFHAARTSFQYDGTAFQEKHWPLGEVARRVRPHMRGGMRLVYAFCDRQVVKEDGSWMVAKSSRWLNDALNTREAVETHAKSTAVARYFAARFNEQLSRKAPGMPSLFFVPCFVYEVDTGTAIPEGEPRVFAGERYLPGVFLKYTSNNGYIGSDGPGLLHREVVEAFAHFSFTASGGRLLVSDLQGVARQTEVLLTDPQVLSCRSRARASARATCGHVASAPA
eukprot:CAMPEP_0179204738 /NCGR_PEP_ID=MMETSP0796-20121207/102067_1 /TAXON_ID=73915 /ORGANISM="Pyrodinium bahamense, Strain pbaha01" /LENGTH=641 /DNA_ID=CAMNT_0020909623 /DNA_START=6 /DNA_END=1932 /DNA_ORIENTATION=-